MHTKQTINQLALFSIVECQVCVVGLPECGPRFTLLPERLPTFFCRASHSILVHKTCHKTISLTSYIKTTIWQTLMKFTRHVLQNTYFWVCKVTKTRMWFLRMNMRHENWLIWQAFFVSSLYILLYIKWRSWFKGPCGLELLKNKKNKKFLVMLQPEWQGCLSPWSRTNYCIQ